MERKKRRSDAAQIEEVLGRLESWRKSGSSRRRIPEPLWRAAAELARRVGVNPIARQLRLDYYSLKRRVQKAPPTKARSKPAESPSPSFVEVEFPAPGVTAECVIEVEDRWGRRMTVRLSGPGAKEAPAMAKNLDKRRSRRRYLGTLSAKSGACPASDSTTPQNRLARFFSRELTCCPSVNDVRL